MENHLQIADLIVKKIRGTITPDEQAELDIWINEDQEHQELFQRAADPKNQLSRLEIYDLFEKDREKVWSALEDELFQTKTIQFPVKRILRFAAAILLPVIAAGGAWLFLLKPAPTTLADLDEVIRPGSQKAVLILSDGESVTLDNELAPEEITEGEATIRNERMMLDYFNYERRGSRTASIYNELRTPRGGSYQLKLADGTQVWLNAGSSLKYPVSFNDSIRKVLLEGEAFFEVTQTGTPFTVQAGNMDVRVLGTVFNVSAYPDEPEFATTLVEGLVSVEISSGEGAVIAARKLEPNDQAVLNLSNEDLSVTEVNPSYYTSWMRGKIEFDNESLDMVMKSLARWYDFEYRFENNEATEYHFTGRLDRDATISSILEMLEMTTDVKFEFRKGTVLIL
jgi:ferric-dicitrate binding protein FerR (iron transport regulator)